MFTFYNKDKEWNLCYNERIQKSVKVGSQKACREGLSDSGQYADNRSK